MNITEEVKEAIELLSVPVIPKNEAKSILWGLSVKQRQELARIWDIKMTGKEKSGDMIGLILEHKFKSFSFGFNH